jgi:hypothetical protein
MFNDKSEIKNDKSLIANFELRIADCATGNPPEGWESEGQFEIDEVLDSLSVFPDT